MSHGVSSLLRTAREARLATLRDEVAALRDGALAAEREAAARIAAVDDAHRAGARNLVHYLSVRAHDLRPLQHRLSAEGLSSLGRMESAVVRNLDAVIRTLDDALAGLGAPGEPDGRRHVDDPHDGPGEIASGPDALAANAATLLGGTRDDRTTRIMVTLPSSAAADPVMVDDLARAGMDLARINCAHDAPDDWERMAAHARAANGAIRIAMDLAGPKLRTGPIAPGPRVLRVKPQRDALGRVTAAAGLWLGRAPSEEAGQPQAPVRDEEWVRARAVGDVVRFTDARGRGRRMRVARLAPSGVRLEGERTAYLTTGMPLAVDGHATVVGELPAVAQALDVHVGDTIELTASLEAATPTRDGRHRIGCTLAEAFLAAEVGHRVAFDDGKIRGIVTAVDATDPAAARMSVEVTLASPTGTKLRAEKGINLPDTPLPVPALTDDDLDALDHVARLADIVQLSFARSADDVRQLREALDARGAQHLGIVVKIEAMAGFAALPEIVLELMRGGPVGIMIARGDLAIEAGFERLAEVQEEILWLCEAAHVPVIWATQVLDTLAEGGVPTRAEVTDAAAGDRAECVMLNKGPHIADAIRALDDILRRMSGHVDKKRALLRRLAAWDR